MSRIARAAWLMAVLVGVIALALASPHSARAETPRPLPTLVRVTPRPIVAPHSASSTDSASSSSDDIVPAPVNGTIYLPNRATRWVLNKHFPKPPMPAASLSNFLIKTGPHSWGVKHVNTLRPSKYRVQAANGSTIILTGDLTNTFANDITVSYGTAAYLWCQNMPNATDTFTYYVFPPDGTGPYTTTAGKGTGDGDGGPACSAFAVFNLSTPWGGFGDGEAATISGSAYPGVWVVGVYDSTTGQFMTEVNIIANATINFTTYATLGLTQTVNDFSQGSNIVVGASGLNPNHNYAIGFVYTGAGGQPCEYTIPTSAKNYNDVVCFTTSNNTVVVNGLQAYGGNLTQEWTSTSSVPTTGIPTGTYDVQLFDADEVNNGKTGTMISHQQISVEANTVAWTLTPVNASGATPPPSMEYNSTYATDGLLDQSVSGLKYNATGLPATSNGDKLDVSVSDPNGFVLTNPTADQYLSAVSTVTQAAAAATITVNFPLSQQWETALGPTQTAFAPNVLTAQLYDTTKASVIASKSFQLLGYFANLAWNSGAALNASTTGTIGAVTITNTGGANYGSWNGDNISGVELSTPTGGDSLAVSSTTATDSAGNAWTITSTGTGTATVIIATETQRTTGNCPLTSPNACGIPVGGTLTFNVTVTSPAADCSSTTGPCSVVTQILPQHGIAYSATDATSNSLVVLNNSTSETSVTPTLTWAVQSETGTANLAARATDSPWLTYVLGTAGAGPYVSQAAGNYYTIDMTLDNVLSPNGEHLTEIELVFPQAVDLNAAINVPILSSITGSGSANTWELCSTTACYNTGGATNGYTSPISADNQNVIMISCKETTANGCGTAEGSSTTFKLLFPLFATTFTPTAITATADFDKGNAYDNNCTACALVSYTVGASSTTQTSIAGNQTIYSNELGSYSLNPSLMNMSFNPATIGTGSGNSSTTLVFTNTSTSQDPNPDYVDFMQLTFPTAANPTSITAPAGWFAWETGTTGVWDVATCGSPGPTNATPCSNPEANAVAPGGQLSLTVKYTTNPAAATYNVGWYVMGANGGAQTSNAASTTPLTFSNTTASFGFTEINGATVTSGSEPQVGTDTVITGSPWSDKGSAYQVTVDNTGSTVLNKIVLSVPYQTRSGNAGSDSHTGNSGYYDVTQVASVTYTGGASGCTSAIVQPTASANGTITLSGCTIPSNATVVINFDAQTPYLIGNEFLWTAQVYQSTTAYTANPTYAAANVISVVENGTLTIVTPGAGFVAPTSPNSLHAIDNTLVPATSCVTCQVFTGSPTTIDFGVFNGTFTGTDVLDASVLSDANSISSNSWDLYITTSPGTNPSNMLSTDVDNTHSSTTETKNQTTLTPVLTSSPGLLLSSYASTAYHGPLDSVMNFQVATGGNTSPEAVTITYTLVFN